MLSVGAGTSYAMIVVPLTALGVGGGLVVPTVTAQLLGSVDRSRSGVASGTLNTLRQTGSAVGVALFGSLLAGSAGFVPESTPRLRSRAGSALAIVALAPLLRDAALSPDRAVSALAGSDQIRADGSSTCERGAATRPVDVDAGADRARLRELRRRRIGARVLRAGTGRGPGTGADGRRLGARHHPLRHGRRVRRRAQRARDRTVDRERAGCIRR